MPTAPPSSDTIAKMLAKGRSPRATAIEVYQRYVDGTIYDGRVDWLDLTVDVPYNERKPCVVYGGVRCAIESHSSMCVGEGHFPVITSMTSEDDSAFGKRFGLTEAQSDVLDAGIRKIAEQTSLGPVAVTLLERAMASGTCVPVVSLQDGLLCVSEIDPKQCAPTFRADGKTVESLRVEYRYVQDVLNQVTGDWEKRVFQFLRVIDESTDVTYWPVEVEDEQRVYVPSKPKVTYPHNFGFCPVVWYRYMDEGTDTSRVDGKPVHAELLPLCDSINFGLSARHGAAIYSGDPQLCESGVDDDGGVSAPVGRVAGAQTRTDDPSGWNLGKPRAASGSRRGRKKGKGTIWTYESTDAKAWYLALPPGALDALKEDADDNIARLRESLGHVYIDPKDLAGSGDVSGKTLAFVYANQVAKCNKIRENFGKRCLLPVLNMLFRVVLLAGDGLYLSGAEKLRPILEKFSVDVERPASNDRSAAAAGPDGKPVKQTSKRWFCPSLKLVWGDYFEMSDNDENVRTANASAALDAGLITKKTAVEHIKPIYKGIENVDEYVETLEAEAEERRQQAMDDATNLARVQAVTGDGGSPKKSPAAAKKVPGEKKAA